MMDLLKLLPRQDDDYTGSFGDSGDSDISTGNAGTDQFLSLIADPFQSQLQQTSFYAALIWSFGVGFLLFLLFCILRPRVSWTYAPRAKYADAKHAPPSIGNGFFSWWVALKAVKEQELVEKIGLDATIFLRFLKMSRNMFGILTVLGCGILIPVNLAGTHLNPQGGYNDIVVFVRLTPQFIFGSKFWAYVVVAYLFTGVVLFFLWSNYRAVTRLRRTYMDSADYRNSLHSRTLLITHIPPSSRTEDGIVRITQEAKALEDFPNTSVARNVKELPQLIEEHEKTVQKLEKVLAKYLADPNKLPAQRPLCKPSKEDKGRSQSHKVDAIDYLTSRIRALEREIQETRETVDQRNPLPYGFASYTHIEDAHAVAYATSKKAPQGTTIKLAPKPHDLIWRNLPMTRAARRTQTAWNSLWMVLLTVLFIPPNVLTAVFLANLHNLGQVWSGFKTTLDAHPVGWSIAQGILAPGIQLLFYFFLPAIFRRFLVRAGDTTKTARERHVTSKLYTFFVFNNLFIFSIFATAWAFIATVINAKDHNVWTYIKDGQIGGKITVSLCNISPYWITWQLQRNLGAAIDIVQAWPLVSNWFLRKFSNPTPRQLVELSAPQPFLYADYYNNYLFVATVGLAYGCIQPLILPVTALYIGIDAYLKKYMLQYICITKVESGGAFWRMLVNRFLFATLLMNAVIALVVGSKGYASPMLYAMIPLLPILAGFKYYCAWKFDTPYNYYTTRSFTETEVGEMSGNQERKRRSRDRVGVKFGNPALYKKLMTPMVHAKSRHLLKDIYRGRLDDDEMEYSVHGKTSRPNSTFGYSDIYMSQMNSQKPGKPTNDSPFELVQEDELDFEHFKRREDFREDFGGDGELYGRPEDASRPGTPSSMMSFGASTMMSTAKPGSRSRSESPASDSRGDSRTREAGHTYHTGYSTVPFRGAEGVPSRDPSPAGYRARPMNPRLDSIDIPGAGLDRGEIAHAGLEAYRDDEDLYSYENRRLSQGSMGAMLEHASGMGRTHSPARIGRKPVASLPPAPRPDQSYRYGENAGPTAGLMGGARADYEEEQTSYDFYRRGRGSGRGI